MKRDNLPEHAALQRISAQMPLNKKVKHADYVIDNSSDIPETERQLNVILTKLYPYYYHLFLMSKRC